MITFEMNVGDVVEVTMASGQKVTGRVADIGVYTITIIRQKLVLISDKTALYEDEVEKPLYRLTYPGIKINQEHFQKLIFFNETVDADEKERVMINPERIESWRYKNFQEILNEYEHYDEVKKCIVFDEKYAKEPNGLDTITYYDNDGFSKIV